MIPSNDISPPRTRWWLVSLIAMPTWLAAYYAMWVLLSLGFVAVMLSVDPDAGEALMIPLLAACFVLPSLIIAFGAVFIARDIVKRGGTAGWARGVASLIQVPAGTVAWIAVLWRYDLSVVAPPLVILWSSICGLLGANMWIALHRRKGRRLATAPLAL